jgi:hypothetical protein
MPIGARCSHCGADAVVPVSDDENDRFIYVCGHCGWWGSNPLRVDFRPNFEITTTSSKSAGSKNNQPRESRSEFPPPLPISKFRPH